MSFRGIVIAMVVVACAAQDDGDGSGGSASSTGGSSSEDASSSGSPIADCESASTAEACASMPLDLGGHPQCGWVELYRVEDADACTLAAPEGRCIDVTYHGEGCGVQASCGQDPPRDVPRIYHGTEDGALVVFVYGGCETHPEAWASCEWPNASQSEPGACACLCS